MDWGSVPSRRRGFIPPGSQLPAERRAAGLMGQGLTLPEPNGAFAVRTFCTCVPLTRTAVDHGSDLVSVLAFDRRDTAAVQRNRTCRHFNPRSDMAGDLHWARSGRNRAGVLPCVLDASAVPGRPARRRLLPFSARTGKSTSVLMRNCVHDDPAVALGPVGPSVVAYPAHPAISEGAPLRTLSPLAAPGYMDAARVREIDGAPA